MSIFVSWLVGISYHPESLGLNLSHSSPVKPSNQGWRHGRSSFLILGFSKQVDIWWARENIRHLQLTLFQQGPNKDRQADVVYYHLKYKLCTVLYTCLRLFLQHHSGKMRLPENSLHSFSIFGIYAEYSQNLEVVGENTSNKCTQVTWLCPNLTKTPDWPMAKGRRSWPKPNKHLI